MFKLARPVKTGLDYYPKDVGFYNDFKIIDLLTEYGPLGVTIYEVTLSLVYRSGYYLAVPSLDKLEAQIIRIIGNRWIPKKDLVGQVIHYCADIGLLCVDLLSQCVITSAEIQQRYAEVTVRNRVDKSKYWLLEKNDSEQPSDSIPEKRINVTETPVSVAETPVSVTVIPQKEIKLNEIKLNESKGEGYCVAAPAPARPRDDERELVRLYNNLCRSLPNVLRLTEGRRQAAAAFLKEYSLDEAAELFKRAEASDFLTGRVQRDERDWTASFDWIIKPENRAKLAEGQYDTRERPKAKRASDNGFITSGTDYNEIEGLLGAEWDEAPPVRSECRVREEELSALEEPDELYYHEPVCVPAPEAPPAAAQPDERRPRGRPTPLEFISYIRSNGYTSLDPHAEWNDFEGRGWRNCYGEPIDWRGLLDAKSAISN